MTLVQKAVVALVLDAPLGDNAEGSVIHIDSEKAEALVSAGIAHEATEDEIGGDDEEADEPEADAPPQAEGVAQDQMRQLSTDSHDTVVKATQKAVEGILKKNAVRRPTFTTENRHVAGSDFVKTGGFKNVGDASLAFIRKSRGDYESARRFSRWTNDPRTKATAMTISGTHQGSDLVPQQWAEEIWALAFQYVPDLLSMMTKHEMRNQIENIPSWVQSSATSGITSAVTAEGSAITATVGTTATVQLSLNKVAALVNLTDELMRFNSYNLESFIKTIVPQRIQYLVNDGVITGTSNQINLVNNSAAVTVIAETPGRINFDDVNRMEAALFEGLPGDAVWLCAKSTLPELYSMAYPNRTASTQFPAFTPGGFGDLLGPKPKGMLLGRPVYTLENVPSLGQRGSLILWSPKSCAYGSTGLVADATPYLYFDLAVDTFRFLFYVDSVNPMTTPYVRKGGDSASNIVILSAGSTSSS